MPYKAVITQRYVFTDKGMRLYSGSVAYNASLLYLYKWPNENIIAQFTLIDVYRRDYFQICTLFYVTNAAFNNLHISCLLT